jgi:hypothetical protein
MDNQIIHITMQEADVYAVDYFIRICGFNRSGAKYEKLLKIGMEIKERIKDRIDIKAIVSSFDRDIIHENTAGMNDTVFVCNAFEQIQRTVFKKYTPISLQPVFTNWRTQIPYWSSFMLTSGVPPT